MWHHSIPLTELDEATSWKVDLFRPHSSPTYPGIKGPTVPVGDLVTERKESVDPTEAPYRDLPYLGLDAVESGTGEIVNTISALEQEIRSRAKAFQEGDILYGRLRAYLNKVALIGPSLPTGSCSGEFYVLVPDRMKVLPDFLRWLLSTPQMIEYVTHRLSGATHPRLSKEDLLTYPVILPSLELQQRAVDVIRAAEVKRRMIRKELEELPERVEDDILQILTSE